MSEPRLVDDIRNEAVQLATEMGVDAAAAERLAQKLLSKICEKWGGERHYIHSLTREERRNIIANDPRHPKVIAEEIGVSIKTVIRARTRRILSNGVR